MKLTAKLFTESAVSMLLSYGLCGMIGTKLQESDALAVLGFLLFPLSLLLFVFALISWDRNRAKD